MCKTRQRFLLLVVHMWCLGFCSILLAQPSSVVTSTEHQPGVELYRQANYKAAANHFKALLKKNKADAVSAYYLGLSLSKQDKLKDASKALENAIKLNPDLALARVALSHLHLRRNKHSEALQEAERAMALDPALADAHYVAGVVNLRSGNPQKAIANANELIKLAPEMPVAHLLKSLAVLGVYTMKARETFNPRVVQASSPATITPEERERRRQLRAEAAETFREAASSLKTYLRLQPSDSSTQQWREQLETLEFYGTQMAPDKEKTPGTERLWYVDEVTTKVRILTKPEPGYTDDARNAGVTGLVILRAVFAADGKVRHILTLSSLPNGLTEQAIKSARLIKFVPATVNGSSVSVALQLEYNFNLY